MKNFLSLPAFFTCDLCVVGQASFPVLDLISSERPSSNRENTPDPSAERILIIISSTTTSYEITIDAVEPAITRHWHAEDIDSTIPFLNNNYNMFRIS